MRDITVNLGTAAFSGARTGGEGSERTGAGRRHHGGPYKPSGGGGGAWLSLSR